MLNQALFFQALAQNGVNFFTGVPDSYLNGFCNYALRNFPSENIIAANEGNAIAIASGHYFGTRRVPLVYMQNSGMGNAINPLASLVEERVYAVPMILLIGWRGQPGSGDWPQHAQQGEITTKLLDVMKIPYVVLEDNDATIHSTIHLAVETARNLRKPYALIAPKGVMAGEKINDLDDRFPLSREEAIEIILDALPKDAIYSATTGRATRELFFLRERRGESKARDFLNVGSMGHASSVALGMALARPKRQVVCLDGDSAAILHLGALTMVSKLTCPNLLHVILNNGAHESVGGQPSAGLLIDFLQIARGCGYHTPDAPVTTREELVAAIDDFQKADRATLIDVHIHKGLRGKLPPLDFSHRAAIDALVDELNR